VAIIEAGERKNTGRSACATQSGLRNLATDAAPRRAGAIAHRSLEPDDERTPGREALPAGWHDRFLVIPDGRFGHGEHAPNSTISRGFRLRWDRAADAAPRRAGAIAHRSLQPDDERAPRRVTLRAG